MHLVFLIQTTQSVNQSVDNYTALDQQNITIRPTEREKERYIFANVRAPFKQRNLSLPSVSQDTRFVGAGVKSRTKPHKLF